MALPTPWFWTSGLQNSERINFCCSKPSSLWYFVIGAPGRIYPHSFPYKQGGQLRGRQKMIATERVTSEGVWVCELSLLPLVLIISQYSH